MVVDMGCAFLLGAYLQEKLHNSIRKNPTKKQKRKFKTKVADVFSVIIGCAFLALSFFITIKIEEVYVNDKIIGSKTETKTAIYKREYKMSGKHSEWFNEFWYYPNGNSTAGYYGEIKGKSIKLGDTVYVAYYRDNPEWYIASTSSFFEQ